MKKLMTCLVLLTFIGIQVKSQSGKVFDNLSMESEILNGTQKFSIYLPPDYENSQRSYPVLYLLHGLGDDHTGWVQFGEVLHIADNAISEGRATPMIIVMPNANNKVIGYFNTIDDTWRYEDFFFEELMPFVEKNYRIKKEKRYRAISGLSMGGGGTFTYALHRPDLFSSACPLSAYIGPQNMAGLTKLNHPAKYKASEEQVNAFISNYNMLQFVEKKTKAELESVRWYIDCGDDDFLAEGNSLMHIALFKKGVNHEYRVRNGGHTWTYWRTALPEVLKFVSDGFHQY